MKTLQTSVFKLKMKFKINTPRIFISGFHQLSPGIEISSFLEVNAPLIYYPGLFSHVNGYGATYFMENRKILQMFQEGCIRIQLKDISLQKIVQVYMRKLSQLSFVSRARNSLFSCSCQAIVTRAEASQQPQQKHGCMPGGLWQNRNRGRCHQIYYSK